jgi:hypothetical protein
MKKLFLILIHIPLIYSCKKSNTRVSGSATYQCTGKPVGNMLVSVYTGERNGTNRRFFIDSTRTWSDGTYELAFRASISDKNFWVESSYFKSELIMKKENNVVDIKIPDMSLISNLDLKVKNVSPFDNNDSIFIDVVRPNSTSPSYHMKYNYKGATVDETAQLVVDGCTPKLVHLTWAVTKNHITTNFSNSVTCTNGATSSFQINY